MRPEKATPVGAYGLAVSGLERSGATLSPAAPGWPAVRIITERAPAAEVAPSLSTTRAVYETARGGHALLDRGAGTITYRGPDPADVDEIAHPLLGMAGAVWAQWLGREAFHAGAFANADGAWAVVGERGAGKSTLMAWLAIEGLDVLGDDTLVVDRGICLAGARCVDLRGDAPEQLGIADRVDSVRRGARRRLLLPAPPQRPPLRGWFFLRWAEEVGVDPVPPPERLSRVASLQRWHRRGATDAQRLLALAALPAWDLRRPRSWDALPATLSAVADAVAQAGAAAV